MSLQPTPKNSKAWLLLALLHFFCFFGFGQEQKEIKEIVYLIGDAGRPEEKTRSTFQLLTEHLKVDKDKSTLFFMGDNIYPGGMPEKEDEKGRAEAEKIIKGQLDILNELDVPFYYVPGNHDWNNGKKNGLIHVTNEEKFIQNHTPRKNVFIPSRGCPGPKKIKIGDDVVIFAIDTQWWLHQYEKPPIEEADCSIRNKLEFITLLKEELNENIDKNIIVMGHHPLYSDGAHGGYFKFKQHIFPLTEIKKNLWIPLPIIGSFYPYYRSNVGHIQDIVHPVYQEMKEELEDAFEGIDNLIYAAGHEHSLQYYEKEHMHYIVSGSASRASYSSGKNGSEFNASAKGFFKVIYYADGSVSTEAWTDGTSTLGEKLFSKELKSKEEIIAEEEFRLIDDSDQYPKTVVKAAGAKYKASKFKQFLYGKYYRAAWVAPVEFPVIDMYREKGGLTPVKIGGGFQSKSLRVVSPEGEQFVLRSMAKFPENNLPDELKQTIAKDIVNDQISASHPYAAYIVPPLASAAGIYHTKPKAYYVPNTPNLRKWQEDFNGQLVLFEQRANNDLTKHDHFGNATEAVNTLVMIEEKIEDHDIVVDEKMFLRNRIFDMFLGDWDRHEGQWRFGWITCKKANHSDCTHPAKDLHIYTPIPKDRDQAFVMYDGLITTIASQKWLMQQFQPYKNKLRNIEGLNFPGRYLDRFLLTEMNKDDWMAMTEDLKVRLTDEVIEEAVKSWPDTIYKLDGPELIEKMKWRRENLHIFAEAQYLNLAKVVRVVGSEKKEYIEVTRLNNDSTRVRMYRAKKSGNVLYYDRTFYRKETQEIRIYGLGGKDEIKLTGDVNKGILVRVIGGYGKDKIEDASHVSGIKNYTHVYDLEKKTQITSGKSTKVHTSKYKSANAYDRKDYKENIVYPNFWLGVNPDDGFFLGGGFTYLKHGFRKEPFKESHRLLGNVAIKNGAFNLLYTGIFTDVFGKTDLRLDALMNNPKSTNFFGYGNQTTYDFHSDNNADYLTRYNSIEGRALLVWSNKIGSKFRLGPQYSYINTVTTPEPFRTPDAGINYISQDPSQYASFLVDYEFSSKNKRVLPTRGLYFLLRGYFNNEVSGKAINNTLLKSRVTFYFPIVKSTTFVLNASGTHVFNKFEYFHSASLGSLNFIKSNDIVRGYRRDRFNGRSSLGINNELRIKLANLRTSLVPVEFGINGFVDVGRVWLDGETSRKWHSSVGGGVWFNPMDLVAINLYYTHTPEENVIWFVLGFIF